MLVTRQKNPGNVQNSYLSKFRDRKTNFKKKEKINQNKQN